MKEFTGLLLFLLLIAPGVYYLNTAGTIFVCFAVGIVVPISLLFFFYRR